MNLIQPRRFAATFGAIYLAVGLVGFALTGFDDPVATHGHLLVIFEVNPLHNADSVLHLVTAAVAGLALWSTRHDIRPRRPVADSATTGR